MRDMKTLSKIFGVALFAITLAACGSSTTPVANTYGYGNNPYGTQTGNTNTQGGCIPLQNGSIPFSIQGAAVSGAVILGGNLPMNSVHPGTYGQAVIGGSGYGGQGMIQYTPFQTTAGTLQITASGGNAQGGMVSGMINLSQTTLYQVLGLAANMGAYQPNTQQYPNQYPNQSNTMNYSNVCVSSVAVDIVHMVVSNGYTGMGQIYRAQVYLYLNNSPTPIGPINFF